MSQTEYYIYYALIILFSLTVHEYSHGKVAHVLGDDTAARKGRLTFNPLKHLDPFGIMAFYFIGFGWAKPVPVDPRNFEHPQRDMMYVAAAGPASNLVLALISGSWIRMISPESNPILLYMLCHVLLINVGLAVLNLIPVFPLDGGSILKGLVPPKVAVKISRLDQYMGLALLGVILLDSFAKTNILVTILRLPISFMVEFFSQESFQYVKQVFSFL